MKVLVKIKIHTSLLWSRHDFLPFIYSKIGRYKMWCKSSEGKQKHSFLANLGVLAEVLTSSFFKAFKQIMNKRSDGAVFYISRSSTLMMLGNPTILMTVGFGKRQWKRILSCGSLDFLKIKSLEVFWNSEFRGRNEIRKTFQQKWVECFVFLYNNWNEWSCTRKDSFCLFFRKFIVFFIQCPI